MYHSVINNSTQHLHRQNFSSQEIFVCCRNTPRYLIPNEKFKVFRKNLALLIKDVLKKCPHLTEDHMLKKMAFPKNWAKSALYKNITFVKTFLLAIFFSHHSKMKFCIPFFVSYVFIYNTFICDRKIFTSSKKNRIYHFYTIRQN